MIHHTCIHCSCLSIGNDQWIFCLFLGALCGCGAIEETSNRCDWAPVIDISCMYHVKIYVENILIFFCLVDLFLAWFEDKLTRTLVVFEDLVPWIHDRFMQMVYYILHSVAKGEYWIFYCIIHVYTQLHGKILKGCSVFEL